MICCQHNSYVDDVTTSVLSDDVPSGKIPPSFVVTWYGLSVVVAADSTFAVVLIELDLK